MKAKYLLFSLLFLMLGTTAWADKYYMPKSYRNKVNPRLTLENAVGKRFMIYNTAVDYDAVDMTGFLRNGGAEFAHDKSKERDLFIYNESFVYTLEAYDDNADGVNDWYAIKSLSTGTYVDCNGKTTHKNPQDAKLNIYNWAAAKEVGVAAWVNMECWEYNIIAREDIEHQDVVLVIGGKYTQDGQEKSAYWNGATNSFATDEWYGHPYVFYEAIELTNEDELPITIEKDFLQELHVFSRCDMYAAQRVCGLVHVHRIDDYSHITVPGQTDVRGIDLCDGDGLTSVTVEAGNSIEFLPNNGGKPSKVHIYLQRNADRTESPASIKVEVLSDGEWTEVSASPFVVDLSPSFTTGEIVLGSGYSRIRISNADENAPMSLSEVYILPCSDVLEDIMNYVNETSEPDNVIFTKASALVYANTLERYNESFPTVKLFSGVPYPGNKYRIFADIPAGNDEHEKKHIYVDGETVKVGGKYFADNITAEERKYFEWYCEKLPNGTLAFKNAVTGKYLDFDANGSGTAFGWNIYTSLSQRNGVPLFNGGKYLAVNSSSLEFVQNISVVQYGGNTTEFVFLPVNMSEGEKKITIKANELVMRNTALKYNGAVYSMPFSHIFTKGNMPTLELQCPVIYPFKGVKVNGVAKENIANQVEKNGVKVLEFDWDNIENGDVLELVFEIEKPFDITPAATGAKPQLYFIRNKRPYGLLPQQARPNRASDANIGIEGDGPISVVGDKFDYAKFVSRGTEMHLVQDKKDNPTSLDATSLFYFTQTESNDPARYYSVNVNNATTVMKFATTGVWDENGGIWYVQPDKAGAYSGYNIGATKLNATNNPSDAWCDVKGADIISFSTPDDDGTAWEFVPVSDNVAKEMLKEFIDKVAKELLDKFGEIADVAAERGYDTYKVECYKYMVNEIMTRTDAYYKGNDESDIFKLVQYAQNIHMLEHEIEYALYELPQLSDETMMDNEAGFANPKWYYVRNVVSGNYAAYTSADHPMNLEWYPAGTYPDGGKRLKNLFYFAGNKSEFDIEADKAQKPMPGYINNSGNNLILDEYLKVHIHNFMSKKNTLVSKNQAVLTLNDTCPGHGIQKIKDIPGGLGNTENWSIEVVYELDGSSFNAYGSCLLSSQKDALNDAFPKAFQVYFKDNRTVAIRAGDRNWDLAVFDHTQDLFSTIRLVVSYMYGTLTIEVYNSDGTVKEWHEEMELNNITALYSALPHDEETGAGINISSLVVRKTEKMNWKEHLDDAQYDLWYILPSSNLNNVESDASNPRFAITLDGPNETNIGWTNASGIIDTAPGDEDNSTWKFERVIQFDNHIDELLAMYNLKDCVIYNKELAALMKLIAYNTASIKANTVGGDDEEKLFNEVYYAILNYNGPMPDELKAPKQGSLYTIRPAVEEGTQNALLVHVDENGTYATKEVYNGDAVRDDNSYDSRAVWMFDGADGSKNTDLNAKNLHTQCYMTALGADKSVVDEESDASITLAPLGACTTMFKVGEQYLNTTASAAAVRYAMDAGFWGSAITEYPANITTIFENVNGHNTVHSKTFDVLVSEQGNVTVTFTHNGGQHKLNILGVTLTDINGKVVAGDYRHTTAGGNPTTQTYTLTNVLPATYTLNCYVCELNGGDNDKLQRAQGDITFSGISQIAGAAKVINTGTAATKWIVEEIKDPENSVYFNVASLSSATLPDGKAYASLYLGFDAKIPDGITAWIVEGVFENNVLDMVEVDGGGIVPANTGLILSSELPKTNQKFYYSAIPSTFNAEDNILTGTPYTKIVDCREQNVYMLGKKNNRIALYWTYENRRENGEKYSVNGTTNHNEGGYVMCNANKSYLQDVAENENAVSVFGFSFGGNTTDIDEVSDEVKGDSGNVKTVYDLHGRKLERIVTPGIYIVNGKKMFVK